MLTISKTYFQTKKKSILCAAFTTIICLFISVLFRHAPAISNAIKTEVVKQKEPNLGKGFCVQPGSVIANRYWRRHTGGYRCPLSVSSITVVLQFSLGDTLCINVDRNNIGQTQLTLFDSQ